MVGYNRPWIGNGGHFSFHLLRLLAHADEPLPATEQDLIDIGQHDDNKQAVFNPYQDEDKGKGCS